MQSVSVVHLLVFVVAAAAAGMQGAGRRTGFVWVCTCFDIESVVVVCTVPRGWYVRRCVHGCVGFSWFWRVTYLLYPDVCLFCPFWGTTRQSLDQAAGLQTLVQQVSGWLAGSVTAAVAGTVAVCAARVAAGWLQRLWW